MAAHKQTAPPPNLLDALECTICLDTPVSPIHECDNGHIVCGVCAERMTECGMCKTKLQISKLAERLSRQLDLKTACSNATSGCLTKVSAAEVRTHQVKCCYRDVICEDQRWPPCDKVSIPFRDFVNHLQTIHQIELEEIITGKMFPVFGSDQFRAHKQTAPPPNLLDALECTICLDTPVSPIHECDNGHIVCGVCAERMTECGMCKTKLQISKLAERLSRQLDLKTACSNATSGCLTKVSAAEVRTHQVKCCYRDVICEDQRWPPCDKVSIPFRDFVNHLQTIHQIELEEIITGKMFPVFGSDQFRAHKQTAPPPNLLDALECTICLDTPVSPIHECDNGHIVCGVCAERMTECGMCKTKLQISKLAERLSRQLDLKTACSNATSGCLTKVSAAEVRTHQVKCCYRDVICEDQRWPPCDKVSIPFRDFVNHLQTIHQIELEEIITGKMFPVFGSDQFRAHKQTAPPPNLLDALECTICLDTPVSPIHECDNGHIVCGVCAERMTECGMCKTKLQISKLAERLSRQLDLKTACSNATSGCLTKVSAAEVRTHQVKCCYRDVICEDQRWPPCDKVSIPFRDFVNHLQTIHQIELEEIITGKMFPVFGSDQFRAHKQTAPPPNLLDALECTICLDTPVSPIHECDNGHIVCGVCAERMTECGMCKTKLQISKLAERLSRQLDLKTACSNATSGCLTKVSAAEVRTHQVKCCYRDVICEDQRWPPCDKVSIPFRDFVNHLQTIHQIELEEIITGKMFPVFGSDQFRASSNPLLVEDRVWFRPSDSEEHQYTAQLTIKHASTNEETLIIRIHGIAPKQYRASHTIFILNTNETTHVTVVTPRGVPARTGDTFHVTSMVIPQNLLHTAEKILSKERSTVTKFYDFESHDERKGAWEDIYRSNKESLLYHSVMVAVADQQTPAGKSVAVNNEERRLIGVERNPWNPWNYIVYHSNPFVRMQYDLKVAVVDPETPPGKSVAVNNEERRLEGVERTMELCYTIPVLAHHEHSKFAREPMENNCATFPAFLLRNVGMQNDAGRNVMPLNFTYSIL
ncbi:putative E3 ubiquitin-protein ligase sinah [Folsomia candida]|uniref:Putative E3 ubiquitin-protein ligase sinah n=1 Tax=Folsomia candida TaxID=158441 RepID=A0A226DVC6_FOLCA|nr:putative E3 ubiquitin-protein ligase sinah [Folsomia candida]